MAIAKLADPALRASQEELADALSAVSSLSPLQPKILKLFLERLELIESHRQKLEGMVAQALRAYQEAVTRRAEVPGVGADSAQQIVAEVGPQAATFPWAGQMASWVGCCPGREESAVVSTSDRSAKGNKPMRRLLSQAANAALKAEGSVFELLYRRLAAKVGHHKAIWAVADRLCRVIWKILDDGVSYEERGYRTNAQAVQKRANRLVRELRRLGYQVQLHAATAGVPA